LAKSTFDSYFRSPLHSYDSISTGVTARRLHVPSCKWESDDVA
jgi:hypothetical protein